MRLEHKAIFLICVEQIEDNWGGGGGCLLRSFWGPILGKLPLLLFDLLTRVGPWFPYSIGYMVTSGGSI